MSKTRDIADSAEVINYLDTVTSNVQDQITAKPDDLSDLGVTVSAENLNAIPGNLENLQIQIDTKASATNGTFTGTITADGLSLGDDAIVSFGAGDDLQIYHDSATGQTIITETGSGNLRLQASQLVLQNAGGTKNYFIGLDSGASTLYHNNSAKISTTSTGADVTGTVTATAFEGDGSSLTGLSSDPTLGTLTKTFTAGESSTINLTSSVLAPVVSVTKEVTQSGVTNNNWDVNSTTENYTRLNSAYATTLSFTGGASPFVLGTGSFASADVGKTIEANDGAFVLKATDGSYVETTAPTSYDQVASGSWEMYGVVYNAADGDLQLSSYIPTLESLADADRWTYNNSSFTLSSQDTSPVNLFFKPDGTKMYVAGFQNNRIHQYTLSTAWDLSTASYDSVFLQTNEIATIGLLIDANISTNGDRIYALDYSAGNSIHEFSLSTPWDLSTATYTNRSKVVPGNSSYCFEMKPDGTKLFIWNSFNHVINQATLSTPWDISTASFSGSYGPVAEATETYGMLLNTAGTKMWLTNYNTNTILQYSLSTPWDVTTITYDSISLNTNAVTGVSQIIGIALSTDESKGYLLNYGTDILYEYKTTATGPSFISTGYHPVHTTASIDSTYWTDINSMTADQAAGDGNVYYAISTDDRTTWTVIDNTDGERDIVRNNAGTWEYNSNATYGSETWTAGTTNTELATIAEAMEGAGSGGYNLSSPSYDSVSFSANSQESFTQAIVFKDDGTKLYVTGSASDTVYQYTLTTAFDLSTASYDSVSFSVSAQDQFPRGLAFSSDGSKMYMAGIINDSVYQYSLSTNWNLSTASYDSVSFSVSGQDLTLQELKFNSIGTKMYIMGDTNDSVFQYTLSSAWDLSTASYDSVSFSVASQENTPTALLFSADGSKMYICGNQNETIYQYSLSVAYDISTSSYDSVSFNTTGQAGNPTSLAFNSNGSKLYVASLSGVIYQYTVGTIIYPNKMDKTQLDAVTDPNHIALGDDLDLAIVFNMTSGTTVPSSDGVAINYDGNVLNKGAILGTDYDFDAPAGDAVRITALNPGNYKVRIV